MIDWQPAETAPIDGRVVLAYGVVGGSYGYTPDEKRVVQARFIDKRWQQAQPMARYDSGFQLLNWSELNLPE